MYKLAKFSTPLYLNPSLISNQLRHSPWESKKLPVFPSYAECKVPWIVTYSKETDYQKELKLSESLHLFSLHSGLQVYNDRGYAKMECQFTPSGNKIYSFDISDLEEKKDVSHCLLPIMDQLCTRQIKHPTRSCFVMTAAYDDRKTLQLLHRLGYRAYVKKEAPDLSRLVEWRVFHVQDQQFDYPFLPLAAAHTYIENKKKNGLKLTDVYKWLPFIKFL
jgi:hypothetical protein